MQCKKRILQNDGMVTSPCARPRKAGHTLLILGGQTFMCDKIYQVHARTHREMKGTGFDPQYPQ